MFENLKIWWHKKNWSYFFLYFLQFIGIYLFQNLANSQETELVKEPMKKQGRAAWGKNQEPEPQKN